MRAIGSALCALLLFATGASAAGPPLQAAVSLEMPAGNGASQSETAVLDGGGAEVEVTATNVGDGRTVDVRLHFSYDVPPDTIALDEIIARIRFATIDADGAAIGTARLRTGTITLNPDGPVLDYRLTLYRPDSPYRARVRIFGNYE